jgi:ABC-type dipeptide/oligopeptide/nickel transport system ATPase component
MNSNVDIPISTQLVKTIDYIFRKGLDTPCLMLIRGNEKEMNEIKHLLQNGESLCGKKFNVHTMCDFLLSQINSLPPIIPTELTTQGLQIESKEFCLLLYKKLPTYNFNTFYYIITFLREVLLHQGDVEKSSVDERIKELLNLTGLADAILDRYPRELSGGQCQRASFARALAAHPQVLVADEPVSALDVSVQARILNLMRDLRHQLNLSIILIAHDLAVVRNVCDKVAVMHKGEFVDFGTAEEVFANPKSDYTKRLLDAVPDVDRSLKNIKTKVHYEES